MSDDMFSLGHRVQPLLSAPRIGRSWIVAAKGFRGNMSRNIDSETRKIWTIRFLWVRRWHPHLVMVRGSCRDRFGRVLSG